ncbi:fumarylacetoacetate hydrolase family protein [Peribacillus frigoritolerans]|uniref:2-keto-4-pentenoate hydratase n=1 Tax=Peribacillus frigoritolerans TaxID=450367 RepID=UPI0024C1CB8C|nr:fumarylacetoacetate hydrolase family protein [Peribacillus frigoritolerans]WHX69565.1 fumarylacetoacetate hydrolase family protein [Peribacillus frigoritolerans]
MSSQTETRIDEAYKHLLKAETEQQSVSPLTQQYPDLTVDEAYRVQLKMIDQKVSGGQRIVGKKIGLTSLAMQQLLGVDQPDYGHLLDSMDMTENESIPMMGLFEPKIEGEIAFILKEGLRGPSVTIEDVLAATDYVVPSLEVVDSRISNWKIKLTDTVADNASSGLFVLGKERFSVKDVDLTKVEMCLYKNGKLINKGTGLDVLGHPAACVAWLANKLYEYDVTLKANEVILSGALSAAVIAEAGDRFKAEFTSLGTVEASFS